jgi:Methyladenine glycosylase
VGTHTPSRWAIDANPALRSILDAARTRHGAPPLEVRLPSPKTPAELAATSDDRYLSQMSLRVSRAGLKHSLVDAKWLAFEEVFHGFDLRCVRAMSDETLEGLLGNARLIRHWDNDGVNKDSCGFRGKNLGLVSPF